MSILAIDVIDRLPWELKAALEADPFFSDIPVIVFDEGNIELEIERQQALLTEKSGHLGAAVIILPSTANDKYPEVAFGPMQLMPVIQTLENIELNRDPQTGTGKSSRKIARKIHQIIKPLALVGLTTEFVPEENSIRPVPLQGVSAKLQRSHSVHFTTTEADSEVLQQVSIPTFTSLAPGQAAVQLDCATAGAAIWFTTDDSFPSPNGKTSQLYAGPIAIPDAGITVRAAAYLAGMVQSQVNRALITIE